MLCSPGENGFQQLCGPTKYSRSNILIEQKIEVLVRNFDIYDFHLLPYYCLLCTVNKCIYSRLHFTEMMPVNVYRFFPHSF